MLPSGHQDGGGSLRPACATCTRADRCPTTGRHSPLRHAQLRAAPTGQLALLRSAFRSSAFGCEKWCSVGRSKCPHPTSTRCGWAGSGGLVAATVPGQVLGEPDPLARLLRHGLRLVMFR
eukprot:5520986-Prymnesium_polylepis.1